jgi:hypothetical protein
MNGNDSQNEKQPRKPNAFTVMKNVRDMCKQPVSKKLLMFTLATYCDLDGICWPGNRTLAAATGMSESTVKRLLRVLHEERELQILTPGIGRDTKRFIHLKRYVKQVTAMTPLNGSRLPMKRVLEQPPLTPSTFSAKKKHTIPKESGTHVSRYTRKRGDGF